MDGPSQHGVAGGISSPAKIVLSAMRQLEQEGQRKGRRKQDNDSSDRTGSKAVDASDDQKDGDRPKREAVSFLPVIRNTCPPIILDSHPFFAGCSDNFKTRAAPEIRVRHFSKISTSSELKVLRRGRGILSNVFEDFRPSTPPQVQKLFEQGKPPESSLDGVLLMFGEDNVEVDVLFNGNRVASVSNNGTFGQEVALGLASCSAFDVLLLAEPKQPMYFLPRSALTKLLADEELADDAAVLQERFAEEIHTLLHEHFLKTINKLKVRLFANFGMDFKTEFLKLIRIRLCTSGTEICREGDMNPSLICVFQGQAMVSVSGKEVTSINSFPGAPAWSAWWGMLEVCTNSRDWSATVCASSDCLVWEFSQKAVKALAGAFPSECRILEKVAMKHAQLLGPLTKKMWHKVYLFEGSQPTFLNFIGDNSTQRICAPKEVVTKAGNMRGEEMYLLLRGCASVLRESPGSTDNRDGHSSKHCEVLGQDACFGDLELLGIGDRVDTVVCQTVCDIRVLNRSAFLEACANFADVAERIETFVENHRERRGLAADVLVDSKLCAKFSYNCVLRLANIMYEQAFFKGQDMSIQGQSQHTMYLVLHGRVSILVDGFLHAVAEAPLIVWEVVMLRPGVESPATVRCDTACDCLALHRNAATPKVFADRFPEDARLLSEAIEQATGKEKDLLETAVQDLLMTCGSTPLSSMEPSQVAVELGSPQADVLRKRPKSGRGAFLPGCSTAFLDVLSKSFERRYFMDGQFLMRQEDFGVHSFFISDGSADVEINGSVVSEVGSGDFLGEVVLLGISKRYTASIRAKGVVRAFAIARDRMFELLEQFPEERIRLEQLMSRRIKANRNLKQLKGPGLRLMMFVHRKGKDIEGRRAEKRERKRLRRSMKFDIAEADLKQMQARKSTSAENNDSDSSDSSLDKARVNLRKVGQETCTNWVRHRNKALAEAPNRRALKAVPFEILAPDQSYRPVQVGMGTAFAEKNVSGRHGKHPGISAQRLTKAKGVYGRPVWREAFESQTPSLPEI